MAKLKTWLCSECARRNEIIITTCENCGHSQGNNRTKFTLPPKISSKNKSQRRTSPNVSTHQLLRSNTKVMPETNEISSESRTIQNQTQTRRSDNQTTLGSWFQQKLGLSKDGRVYKNQSDNSDHSDEEDGGGAYHLSFGDGTASTKEITTSSSYDTEEDFLCRMQDFKYAQHKRKESYGDESPWGILGLYEHLTAVRIDIEWADDVAWRKENNLKYVAWNDFDDIKKDGMNRPFFTYIVVFVSTVMMFVEQYKNGWRIEPLSVNPMIGPSAETLISLGAKFTDYIVNKGQYYRLFTPMFLHAGWIHFILNMFAVYAIGTAVEIAHGTLFSAVIFIASSVGGTILSALFLPGFISVGASGGIFGYIGACLADILLNWNLVFARKYDMKDSDYCRKFSMIIFLISDVGINCLVGMTPFVDNFTHMGGMFYGFVIGLSIIESISLKRKPRIQHQRNKNRMRTIRTLAGCFIILLGLKTSALYLLTGDGVTSPCPACRYTSCVSFPPWNTEEEKWWYCDNCGSATADVELGDEGYFSSLSLNCPDDSQVDIDVSAFNTNDESMIQEFLPFFCRDNCENVYF